MIQINTRCSWDEYFTQIAEAAASRSTCPRRQVGCVLVKDKKIIRTGYNGAPSTHPHCTDVGCDMVDGVCKRTTHAECNALDVPLRSRAGSSLYCTDFPCPDCAERIVTSGVVEVIYMKEYHSGMEESMDLFHFHGIVVRQLL